MHTLDTGTDVKPDVHEIARTIYSAKNFPMATSERMKIAEAIQEHLSHNRAEVDDIITVIESARTHAITSREQRMIAEAICRL